MDVKELSPAASAVFWLFTYLGDRLRGMQSKQLVKLSGMHTSTFYNGVNEAAEKGLIERNRTGFKTLVSAESIIQAETERKSQSKRRKEEASGT